MLNLLLEVGTWDIVNRHSQQLARYAANWYGGWLDCATVQTVS